MDGTFTTNGFMNMGRIGRWRSALNGSTMMDVVTTLLCNWSQRYPALALYSRRWPMSAGKQSECASIDDTLMVMFHSGTLQLSTAI